MSTLTIRPGLWNWGRLFRHRKTLAMSAIATPFLAAACGGAGTEASISQDAAAASSAASAPVSASTEAREEAADFELTLYGNGEHTAGDTIHLSDFAGDPVVLNFWFPSCPPCVAEMPDFEAAYQDMKDDSIEFIGVQLLGLDTAEDGQEFIDGLGVNYMIGADETADTSGEIIRNYKVIGFPTTVFIDRDQRIARSWSGALNREKLDELIQDIVN